MKKRYREITFDAGDTIEAAVKYLKKQKDLVCGSFNGEMLYSDIDDVNSAYKKVVGKTKAEFDACIASEKNSYKEEERKHKESIPELTKEWIKKGNDVLDEKYRELWAECVPVRLGDLYRGMELGCCLEIVQMLNNDSDFDTTKNVLYNQGHSGMSFGLVCSMIVAFCNRGFEFVNYVRI